MATNDGGPAFPRVITEWDQQPGETDVTAKVTSVGGMTLRDYFAAKFAAAWVVALSARIGMPGYLDSAAAVEANRLGLLQADAMLAEREAGK